MPAENGEQNTSNTAAILTKLIAEIKSRRGLVASGVGAEDVLQRVRKLEEDQNQNVPVAAIAAAKGEDIDRLALLDTLTELYNHRTFLKELKAELSRADRYEHPVSLCMIAVDNLETVAQQFGFLTVDGVIKVTANVIRESAREVDLTARYSATQFVIVLPQTTSAGAALFAERLRQRIANQVIAHNWQNFSVTASFGVATFPDNASKYDQLIAGAMQALEFAVNRGGDRVLVA
jgi:diguanylate cyclase (GGDEF)-like protein